MTDTSPESFAMTPEEHKAHWVRLRTEIYSGNEADLYSCVGHFFIWFSAVELALTFILAKAVDTRDFGAFDLLVAGMDARVKCHRLRQACGKFYLPMGPNFNERLDIFEKKCVDLRNKFAHSWLASDPPHTRISFTSLGRFPGFIGALGEPPSISAMDVFRRATWLNNFATDLFDMIKAGGPNQKVLEIQSPRSCVPWDFWDQPPAAVSAKP